MAVEPVSSALTIATTSLAIIHKTIFFIRETKVVDQYIVRLQQRLLDLKKLIELVEKTCRQHGGSQEDDHFQFIVESLNQCCPRLEEVSEMVKGLASKRAGSFLQKVSLKIRSDWFKGEIDEAVRDIDHLMDQVHKSMNCWNFHLTSLIERRTSESPSMSQAAVIRNEVRDRFEAQAISALSRSWSDATAYELAPDPCPHSAPLVLSPSRAWVPSVSPPILSSENDLSDSVGSIPSIAPFKPESDWVDFHYQIRVCEGKEERIQAVQRALQEHPERTRIANSTDSSKRSPLHLAAQRGDVQLARVLLEFSADINAKDSQPSSVLDLAVSNNHEDFVAFLLEQGVDEAGLLKQNRYRFEEIKETIEFLKSKRKKPKEKRVAAMRWKTINQSKCR